MGGSATDGLIFADFRATSPLVVQINRLSRPSRRPGVGVGGEISSRTTGHASTKPALSRCVFEDESINSVQQAAGLFRIIEYYRSVWLAIKAGTTYDVKMLPPAPLLLLLLQRGGYRFGCIRPVFS